MSGAEPTKPSGSPDEGALTRAVEAALRAHPSERLPAWATTPTDQQPVLRAMPGTASPGDAEARSAAARQAAAARRVRVPAPTTEAPAEPVPAPPVRLDDLPLPGDYTPPPDLDWPTGDLGRVFLADTETPDAVRPRRKRPKRTRRPAAGLVGLILFAFAGAFFAWFAAGPLWLTLGHRHPGTAVVDACPSGRTGRLCAEFTAADQSFTATVTLLAASETRPAVGTRLPAYMVDRTGSMAYAGDPDSFYLRWVPGVALTVLCGLGIAWSTGAFRLRSRRAKALTALASLAGPILVLGGMLAVSW